jgi:TM2 domain-containing membrane protein YozV/RNA polymerase subunit RPABC4/transcription elongation factor Spt4
MALLPCRECGHNVSTEATTCPNCGVPGPVRYDIPTAGPGQRIVCRACGGSVPPGARMCPHCDRVLGMPVVPQQQQQKPSRRGSGGNVVAGIASFFIPGLGQIVQGRLGAGILHFVIAVVVWVGTLGMAGWIVNLASAYGAATWEER